MKKHKKAKSLSLSDKELIEWRCIINDKEMINAKYQKEVAEIEIRWLTFMSKINDRLEIDLSEYVINKSNGKLISKNEYFKSTNHKAKQGG